jgi:hypothetical protein
MLKGSDASLAWAVNALARADASPSLLDAILFILAAKSA